MKSKLAKIEQLKNFINELKQPKHYSKKIKRLTTYPKT